MLRDPSRYVFFASSHLIERTNIIKIYNFIFVLFVHADCDWKARTGNVCVASFDWSCSGICKSVERLRDIHKTCGEGDGAVWNVDL